MMEIMLEICVDTIESAKNAVIGGATRLEICSALSEGGLTPTPGLIKRIREISPVPIYAMIRVRGGNFVYSREEMDIMLDDLKILKELNVDGFVFGALTNDRHINISNCKEIIDAAYPLPVTFHRAFDVSLEEPKIAIDILTNLGFKRILSSGRKETADKGCELLSKMCKLADKKISIMPGCGITPNNLMKIKLQTGAVEFHASARCKKQLGSNFDRQINSIKMGDVSEDDLIMVTNSDTVKQMVNILLNDIPHT
ncbi:PREDICTED: copper homeostasis protein cutC homolog [Polistes dominula]|uniref:Copper homeostasis protein cutC homolog n=1 Tax=Polistes dominula TaxID=743375 RepID=A0ABM1IHY1_POLDO|nr:PREDICTED: copper homeostasis protein cutC homolog [Polistes dominula]XP_015179820.1 PREDICTED: copper homeostasis protein cutC homolog [Polistes dominula]